MKVRGHKDIALEFYGLIKAFSDVKLDQKSLTVTEGSKEGVYEVSCGCHSYRCAFSWPTTPRHTHGLTGPRSFEHGCTCTAGADRKHAALRHRAQQLAQQEADAGEGGHRGVWWWQHLVCSHLHSAHELMLCQFRCHQTDQLAVSPASDCQHLFVQATTKLEVQKDSGMVLSHIETWHNKSVSALQHQQASASDDGCGSC